MVLQVELRKVSLLVKFPISSGMYTQSMDPESSSVKRMFGFTTAVDELASGTSAMSVLAASALNAPAASARLAPQARQVEVVTVFSLREFIRPPVVFLVCGRCRAASVEDDLHVTHGVFGPVAADGDAVVGGNLGLEVERAVRDAAGGSAAGGRCDRFEHALLARGVDRGISGLAQPMDHITDAGSCRVGCQGRRAGAPVERHRIEG